MLATDESTISGKALVMGTNCSDLKMPRRAHDTKGTFMSKTYKESADYAGTPSGRMHMEARAADAAGRRQVREVAAVF